MDELCAHGLAQLWAASLPFTGTQHATVQRDGMCTAVWRMLFVLLHWVAPTAALENQVEAAIRALPAGAAPLQALLLRRLHTAVLQHSAALPAPMRFTKSRPAPSRAVGTVAADTGADVTLLHEVGAVMATWTAVCEGSGRGSAAAEGKVGMLREAGARAGAGGT